MTQRFLVPLTLATVLLAGCGGSGSTPAPGDEASVSSAGGHEEHESHDAHAGHAMDGGPAPKGMRDAADPTYPVGTEVTLTADHMPGMEGAPAEITGAFSTTTYSVSYQPTTGGQEVTDHRWVVHEELREPGEPPLEVGDQVVLEAEHMPGMEGAEATIDSVTDETVYMVDLTADGMTMTNHKWVVESEVRRPAG